MDEACNINTRKLSRLHFETSRLCVSNRVETAQRFPQTVMSSFSSKAKSNPAVSHHRTPERILSEDQVNEIREAFELFAIQSNDCLNYHELKVAMRALGFDLKKAEVFKLLKDHTADGKRIGFDAFNEMSAFDYPVLSPSLYLRSVGRAEG